MPLTNDLKPIGWILCEKMQTLPKDVLTLIFCQLSSQPRHALLAAFPQLASKIDWNAAYENKYDATSRMLRALHDKNFPIRKMRRLAVMASSYHGGGHYADCMCGQIPVVESCRYKLDDYRDDVTDAFCDAFVDELLQKVKTN